MIFYLMLDARPRDIYSTLSQTCGTVAIYIGCIVIMGWALGWQFLTSIRADYIPAAPNTALCFVLLGGALVARKYGKSGGLSIRLSCIAAIAVFITGSLSLLQFVIGSDFGIDRLLISTSGKLGPAPVGYMSPVTAAIFLAASSAMGFLLLEGKYAGAQRIAAALSTVVAAAGLVILMGYSYGSPFFYGGVIIPVSLITAVFFVLIGFGMITAAGPRYWPLSSVVGQSIHARLIRAFLPLTIAIIILEAWLYTFIFNPSAGNPALLSALITALSIIAVSAIVSEISKFISGKIEHAEEERRKLQALIERAKNEWEETFDIINDAITIHDKNFNIIRANKAAVELLDTTFSLILKKKCFISYHGTDCPPAGCPSCRTLQTGEPSVSEVFEHRLNKFLEIKALTRFDEENKISGAVHVVRDITDRKKAERKLEESQERLITVLDSLDAAVYVADMGSYEVLYANKYLRDMFGDAEGKICWQALQRSQIGPCKLCTMNKLLDPDGNPAGVYSWEYNHVADGRCYSISDRAIRWVDGRIVRLEIATDITARKHTEEALLEAFRKVEEEKAKSEAIIAAIGDGISIQDTDFKILYQNNIHKNFAGDHAGEYCYSGYKKRDFVCEGCPVAMTFKDGGVHVAERSVPTGDGILYFEITASPLMDADGKIAAGIEVVRDVTEDKRLKNQLLHAQKMDAIGQLAGGVAHDFNNILTAIMGYVYMLQVRMDRDSPLMTYVEEILDSAAGAANLTRSLLAFSRKQIINPKPVDLNEIIKRFGKLLRNLIGEEIELNITPAAGDLTVIADSLQIEQVLMNLVTNARDAMRGGGEIYINTGLAQLDAEFIRVHDYGKVGEYALLSISDSGAGMDERTRERIFEPFFTTKETGKGTGLGLSIVFGIIKQHNGYINVYSEPGKGTTFKIYLPLIGSGIKESDLTEIVPPAGGTETILVAEDEAAVRKAIKSMLEKFGYKIIEAVDGEDAIDKFAEGLDDIRLVILDVIMPKRNGKEVNEEIKKLSPGVKVLFTSGYTADIIHRKGILDKGLHFISKPLMPNELLRIVREVLDT